MLVEVSPDVVLVTHLMHHSPGYIDIAHRWGAPVVLELHDFFMLCPRAHLERRSGDLCAGPEGGRACARHCFGDQENAQLRWALRARSFTHALRAAEAVVAPSSFLADAFAEARGAAAPIRIVENSIGAVGPVLRTETDEAAPLHLASIGVTVNHKGFQIVLEALRLANLPAVSYVIFGVALPPLSIEMQAAAAAIQGLEFRLANGFQPRHLPALLGETDVVVVPSLVAETYSIVLREAFACGLPVIASRIGALPAAIEPGSNGWLVEPGDPVELAELLRRLHHDRSLIQRAAAGARVVPVTDAAQRSDQVEALLEEVVAGGTRADDGNEALELGLMREALATAGAST
jgi:glycosyltransferase involved in cell wall biosynthesis